MGWGQASSFLFSIIIIIIIVVVAVAVVVVVVVVVNIHTYIHTYITLHYITLHYIYFTLHYIYITLLYITLHYIHPSKYFTVVTIYNCYHYHSLSFSFICFVLLLFPIDSRSFSTPMSDVQDFAEQHRHRACEVLGPHAGAAIAAGGVTWSPGDPNDQPHAGSEPCKKEQQTSKIGQVFNYIE